MFCCNAGSKDASYHAWHTRAASLRSGTPRKDIMWVTTYKKNRKDNVKKGHNMTTTYKKKVMMQSTTYKKNGKDNV